MILWRALIRFQDSASSRYSEPKGSGEVEAYGENCCKINAISCADAKMKCLLTDFSTKLRTLGNSMLTKYFGFIACEFEIGLLHKCFVR